MSAQPAQTAVPIHLHPDEYHLVGPDDMGAAGLRAHESVGPFTSIAAIGPLVTVQDRRFEPRSEVSEQPHRGMERLLYVLEGVIQHGNSVPAMSGAIRTGDLGILTEGQEGMIHTERNLSDAPARAYVLAYPADPLPEAASFHVVLDETAPRVAPHEGTETKILVERASQLVHGQVHEAGDTSFEVGGALPLVLEPGEGALLFCIEGRVQVTTAHGEPTASIGRDDTVLFPPAPEARRVLVDAQASARVFHAVTGTGFGFRLQDPGEEPHLKSRQPPERADGSAAGTEWEAGG